MFSKLLPPLVLAGSVLLTLPAPAATRFDAYAAPGAYGPWYNLPAHLGPVTYTVSYHALGKTSVTGEVKFIAARGTEVTLPFNGSITFQTGNFVAVPKVHFRGIPFGSVVKVTVSP